MKSEEGKSQWFNEIHDSNGNIRAHYKNLYNHWQSVPAKKRKRLHVHSKKLFSGDYCLDPLPRIITGPEFATLQKGVRQRAEAIREFLVDFYGGGKRWEKVIPPDTLKTIINRHHEKIILGKLNPRSIAFPFGPDIIRDQNGKWRVIEDSAGFLGGIGDLIASREIMFKLMPRYQNVLGPSNDPKEFFIQLASHFHKRAEQKGGIPLLYLDSFSNEGDHETQRLGQIFDSIGVEVCTPEHKTKNLLLENDGVFLQKGNKKRRVGYLALYAGPEQTDSRCFSLGIKTILGKEIKKMGSSELSRIRQFIQHLKGLSIQSSILKNQLHTNFSPGVQFINDKMFGLFVDSMIRLYLKKDPILESIPAQSFAFRGQRKRWRLDRTLLKNVMRRKDQYVIKLVDEDGGSGVWIGQKHTRKGFEKLTDSIRNAPEKYIFQEFEHLSVLENRIVDLRIHSQVDCEKIIVSNNPWGRANWIHNDGKVNLGSNGFTSPVVIVP